MFSQKEISESILRHAQVMAKGNRTIPRIEKIQNQTATCFVCGKKCNERIYGSYWFCEDHLKDLKIEITTRLLDGE